MRVIVLSRCLGYTKGKAENVISISRAFSKAIEWIPFVFMELTGMSLKRSQIIFRSGGRQLIRRNPFGQAQTV